MFVVFVNNPTQEFTSPQTYIQAFDLYFFYEKNLATKEITFPRTRQSLTPRNKNDSKVYYNLLYFIEKTFLQCEVQLTIERWLNDNFKSCAIHLSKPFNCMTEWQRFFLYFLRKMSIFQLLKQLGKSDVFLEYREGPIDFNPTYKFNKDSQDWDSRSFNFYHVMKIT